MYLADKKNQAHGCPNEMVKRSVEQGVEADIFEPMPDEAKEFLIKYHNGMDDKRDMMTQMKLVKKAVRVAWPAGLGGGLGLKPA